MTDQRQQPGRLLGPSGRNLLGRSGRDLLGPSGYDIGCEHCFELLDVYVEAELAGEDADRRVPGMRTHLEGCPACAEEHASLRDLLTVPE